jgi:hypothetical protein
MDLFVSRFDDTRMELRMPEENTLVFAFAAGMVLGFLLFLLNFCCTPKEEYQPESAGDLFEAENRTNDEDDFRDFIITRLSQSPAFRTKMVNGMAKLHDTHPKIYAEVMRK